MNTYRLVVAALVGWLLVGALSAAPQFVPGPGERYAHSMAYDSQRDVVVLFGGNRTHQWPQAALADTWEWDGLQWTQVSTNGPSSRGHCAMAYDSNRGVCVLFGGYITSTGIQETWEWDGQVWTERTNLGPQPPRRWHSSMVYDAARQVCVLFGGSDNAYLGDTWEYDGVAWSQVSASGPVARSTHDMAYVESAGHVLLFGGASSGGLKDDTWTWNGSQWTEVLTSSGVPARQTHGMCYDAVRDRVVCFGGYATSYPGFNDTWEWDGAQWTQAVSAVSPSVRSWVMDQIVYDRARGECVLFGGTQAGGSALGDTWTFDGVEWRPKLDYVTSPINGNRYALTPPMTWQDAEDLAVLEGGHLATVRSQAEQNWLSSTYGQTAGGRFIGLNDAVNEGSWVWSSGESSSYTSWASGEPNGGASENHCVMGAGIGGWADVNGSNGAYPGIIEIPGGSVADVTATLLTTTATPAPVRSHALASLPSGGALLFGGEAGYGPFAFTYEFDGTDWNKQLSTNNPLSRTGHSLLLDEARQNNMMFGGRDPLGGKRSDTWTYANGQWSYLTPSNAPSPRSHHAMAYDPTTGTGILFGGEDAFATAISDMWQWDGTDWTQAAPATLPPARMRHGIVWDRLRDVLVLFGGTDGTTRLNDIWEWDGTDWAQITPAQPNGVAYGPSGRDGFVMAYDPRSERVVVIGGETDNGCVDEVWSWDGNAWLRHLPTSGSTLPSARKDAVIFVDALTNEMQMFGGGCGSNYSDELWSFQLPVFARSEVIGVGCAGSNGVPTLSVAIGTAPVLGAQLDFDYINGPTLGGFTPVIAVGFNDETFSGLPLPLPLAVLGLPGCTLYHSADVILPASATSVAGEFVFPLLLPNNSVFLGTDLFLQGLHYDFSTSTSWAALSNAVGIRIGDQ